MVFSNFIKCSKCSPHDRLQFFQSSHPYLNNGSLMNYKWFQTKRWTNPNPSSAYRNYLTIDNGHYGLYYTVYNHDAERNKPTRTTPLGDTLISFIITHEENQTACIDYATQFFISKINQDIHNNINQIKKISRKCLSAMAVVSPRVKTFHPKYDCPVRFFSSMAIGNPTMVHNQNFKSGQSMKIEEITENDKLLAADRPVTEAIPSEMTGSVTSSETLESENFESILLNTQVSSILNIYNNHSSPEELNMIYPLYQSLKRNNIELPDIGLYNVVLHSISVRPLDSEDSLESIESKLTNLLTIYQDILKSSVKPSIETFDIVVSNLFGGSIKVLDSSSNFSNIFIRHNYTKKAKEFGQIGIELFESIQKKDHMNIVEIIPQVLKFLCAHPDLITKSIVQQLLPFIMLPSGTTDHIYYQNLIEFTKHFANVGVFEGDSERAYNYIVSIYEQFKEAEFKSDEFVMYGKLVESLIYNGQFVVASKFLDDILLDYKHSLENSQKPRKSQLSLVISCYVSAIINNNPQDLDRGYALLEKFNGIAYLPELELPLYNDMIVKYTSRLQDLQVKKAKSDIKIDSFHIEREVKGTIERIWSLYDHMAIRRDYQETSTMALVEESKVGQHARDAVLSLSIDLGDHERIFQIIKEVLLKNHLIYDLIGFKKLLSYLYNGVIYNASGQPFNQYYYGLVWNLVEGQFQHYSKTSIEMNEYLSEIVNFLILTNASEQTHEYNLRLFLQSQVVQNALRKFDLQFDNIYGLILISKSLMSYRGNDIQIYSQILDFQAKLVNQLEEIDNHYIDFADDMVQYKNDLLEQFKFLMSSLPSKDVELTNHIIEACKRCEIEVLNEIAQENLEETMKYDLNLCYLLAVNYEVGMENFFKSFQRGLSFNSSTWDIVLNHKFLMQVISSTSMIKISEVISRIWESHSENASKLKHLRTLVDFNHDKINIKLIEFLTLRASDFKEIDSLHNILIPLIRNVSSAENQYVKGVLANAKMVQLFYLSKNNQWVIEFLKFLNANKDYEKTIEIIENFNLLGAENIKGQIVEVSLEAHLQSNKLEEFITLFRREITDRDAFRKSPNLVELIITYYMKLGGQENLEIVLSKFREMSHVSQGAKEMYLHASLMYSLQTGIFKQETERHANSINELSMKLLCTNNLKSMIWMYKSNLRVVCDTDAKNTLVDKTLKNLLIAASSANIKIDVSSNTFQRLLRFFKLISLNQLTMGQFMQVVKILTVNKSKEALNILLSKLVNGTSLASIINFYFLEIRVSGENEGLLLLSMLNKSFTLLNDSINAYRVQEFCEASGLKLPSYT